MVVYRDLHIEGVLRLVVDILIEADANLANNMSLTYVKCYN